MQIDWFTLLAEVVNFLILVVVLKKLLYDRIIQVAEERETQIANRYAEAEQKTEAAQKEAESYRQKQQELEDQRDAILAEAHEEAEQRRQELLSAAKDEVTEKEAAWREAVAREKAAFLRGLHEQAGDQVYAVSRRVLQDLADAELEAQIVDVFVERMETLSEEEQAMLTETLGAAQAEGVVVRSAFELDEQAQQAVREAVQRQTEVEPTLTFDTDPEMVCGLMLRVDNQKIEWSVEQYLERLHEKMEAALEERLEEELTLNG